MCGIAGLMTRGAAPSPAVLDSFAAALGHRGPDGQGRYAKDNTALVQTRLAIIDLATGDQPIFEPGGCVLVANGEIYNYIELRAAMPDVRFATQSDSEIPLHLYRRCGLDFAKDLRGMYAIAIHDPAANRLVLARDPFGIKPLYYAETPHGFAFASEPRALIAAGFVCAVLSPQQRNELLQVQFTTGRDTIFEGIHRVLPGEMLIVENGRIAERRRIGALPEDGPRRIDAHAARTKLDEVWQDSVNIHQRSDVPYGMFLSGGVDSSAVLAMMARLNTRPVQAFTAGFSGTAASDERALAQKVARSFGAEHTEIDFTEDDFWKILPLVAAAMDDPTADYAVLPTWKLAEAARGAGLKVILSGEGGDELFGGYGRYRSAMRPWWLGGKRMRRRGTFDGLDILREKPSGWRDGMSASEAAAKKLGLTRLQIAQAVDCAGWLPNDLLIKLDRCLMAHGIEGRTPFLDREVAAFAYRLPDNLKIANGLGKSLLRKWLAEHAPAAEPFSKKRGFTVPVGEWVARRGAMLGELVARQECIRELCRTGSIETLFRAAADKRHGFAAWSLLFYALWHRRHIEGAGSGGDIGEALSG
ncbi:MAG: asparagine synthase (glutamine-hydrolyzing) [Bdellovibrionales bacterium]